MLYAWLGVVLFTGCCEFRFAACAVNGTITRTRGDYISGETDVDINCTFPLSVATEELQISWTKDGRNMSDSGTRIEIMSLPRQYASRLKFAPILQNDEGTYSCEAEGISEILNITIGSVYDKPVVVLTPTVVTIVVGTSSNLTCNVTNKNEDVSPLPNQLVWCINNTEFNDRSNVTFVENGLETLTVFWTNDVGKSSYGCGVVSCADNVTVEKTEYVIRGFYNRTESFYIAGETSVELRCTFTTSHQPEDLVIVWMKDGITLNTTAERISLIEDITLSTLLRFSNITNDDEGNYTCTASDRGISETLHVAVVDVYDAAVVVLSPSEVSLHAGQSQAFTCNVTNRGGNISPLPERLVWCYGNSEVTNMTKIARAEKGLEQLMVTWSNMVGIFTYSCGIQSCTEHSTLHNIGYFIDGRSTQTPGTYISTQTPVELNCTFTVTGEPKDLQTRWLIDGRPLPNADRIRISTDSEKLLSQLKFSDILIRDQGTYTCTATDRGVTGVCTIPVLKVYEPIVVRLTPSVLSLRGGQHQTFTCEVINRHATIPSLPLQLTWCHNSKIITDRSDIAHVGEGVETLNVTAGSGSGNYSCGFTACTQHAEVVTITLQGNPPPGPESYYTSLSTDQYCESETDYRGTFWPAVITDAIVSQYCPKYYIGSASRACNTDSIWDGPEYINCVNRELVKIDTNLDGMIEGDPSSRQVNTTIVTMYAVVVAAGKNATSGDLELSIDIIEKLSSTVDRGGANVAIADDTIRTFAHIIDNILSRDLTTSPSWEELRNTTPTRASSMMKGVSYLGLSAARGLKESDQTVVVDGAVIDLELDKIRKKNTINFPANTNKGKSKFELSLGNVTSAVEFYYVATLYSSIADVLPTLTSKVGIPGVMKVNSHVLSLSLEVDGKPRTHLDDVIRLTFEHLQKTTRPVCAYWNYNISAWMVDGCTAKIINESFTLCECNQLSDYVLFMTPVLLISEESPLFIRNLTIAGCAVSILGCLVTILTHLWMWGQVSSAKAVLVVNWCLALMSAYAVLLADVFIVRAEDTDACTAVAALLHFLLLSSFFLMLAQMVEVAIQVDEFDSESHKLKILLPVAWVVPGVIVGATLGVIGLEGYTDTEFCFLNVNHGVLYSFVGPAALMIVITFITIVVSLRALRSSDSLIDEGLKEKVRAVIRRACVLVPLLAICCILWYLSLPGVSVKQRTFQYLFPAFSALQGLLIFVFYCACNREVKDDDSKIKPLYDEMLGFDSVDKLRTISQIMHGVEMREVRSDSVREMELAMQSFQPVRTISKGSWHDPDHIMYDNVTALSPVKENMSDNGSDHRIMVRL